MLASGFLRLAGPGIFFQGSALAQAGMGWRRRGPHAGLGRRGVGSLAPVFRLLRGGLEPQGEIGRAHV